MLKIAVCDDNLQIAQKLCEKIKKINSECSVEIFTDGAELVKCDCKWDVVFLDIEMQCMDGFETAKFLSENKKCSVMSFVTTHAELAIEGYDYQPFRYILKEAPDSVIDRKIKETIEEYYKRNKAILISYKGIQRNININDIKYIEITGHKLQINLDGEILIWNKPINEIEKEFEKYGFIRCHRSFMVSLKEIKQFAGKEIILKDKTIIPVGRLYKKQTEEAYLNFAVQ